MAPLSRQRARLSHLSSHSPLTTLTLTSFLQQLPRHHHQLRYASGQGSGSGKSHERPSTSAQPAEKRAPTVSSTSSTPLLHDVNPPPSTLPADLELPEPLGESAGLNDKAQYLLSIGRGYLAFYKTGLKNVYHNYKASLAIRRQLGIPSYLPVSPAPKLFLKGADAASNGKGSGNGSSKEEGIEIEQLQSRSTFQLLHRAAYDVRRMIPFGFILLFFGEFTPLMVLAFGNAVVPFTCRIPKQLAKYRTQRTERKRAALSAHEIATRGSMTPPQAGSKEELDLLSKFISEEFVKSANAEEVLRACAVFGLVKSHRASGILVEALYRPRLRKFAEYLEADDMLIRECNGVTAMTGAEVRVAVGERGGFGLLGGDGPDSERVERRWLQQWLERSQ